MGDYTREILGKVKQLVIPIIFLIIVINIPIAIHYYIGQRPDPPPPGWSSIWIYYLHGDFDYFFRLRILPQTLPFWAILGIILTQMTGVPHRLQLRYDLLFNLILGMLLTVIWTLLAQIIFVDSVSGDWIASAFPFTPILAMIAVPLHRIFTRGEMAVDSQ